MSSGRIKGLNPIFVKLRIRVCVCVCEGKGGGDERGCVEEGTKGATIWTVVISNPKFLHTDPSILVLSILVLSILVLSILVLSILVLSVGTVGADLTALEGVASCPLTSRMALIGGTSTCHMVVSAVSSSS